VLLVDVVVVVVVDVVVDEVVLVVARPPLPPVPLVPEALDVEPPVPVAELVGSPSLIPKRALHAESRPPQSSTAGAAPRTHRRDRGREAEARMVRRAYTGLTRLPSQPENALEFR
jgi:hypothetical protein